MPRPPQVPSGSRLHGHDTRRAVPEGAVLTGPGGLRAERLGGNQEPGTDPERGGIAHQEKGTGPEKVLLDPEEY